MNSKQLGISVVTVVAPSAMLVFGAGTANAENVCKNTPGDAKSTRLFNSSDRQNVVQGITLSKYPAN
jgi:hypothetical protein